MSFWVILLVRNGVIVTFFLPPVAALARYRVYPIRSPFLGVASSKEPNGLVLGVIDAGAT